MQMFKLVLTQKYSNINPMTITYEKSLNALSLTIDPGVIFW